MYRVDVNAALARAKRDVTVRPRPCAYDGVRGRTQPQRTKQQKDVPPVVDIDDVADRGMADEEIQAIIR